MADLSHPVVPTRIRPVDLPGPPLDISRQAFTRRFYDAHAMMKTRRPGPSLSGSAACVAGPALLTSEVFAARWKLVDRPAWTGVWAWQSRPARLKPTLGVEHRLPIPLAGLLPDR